MHLRKSNESIFIYVLTERFKTMNKSLRSKLAIAASLVLSVGLVATGLP